MPRKSTNTPRSLNHFSGYPAELIARWCGVSVQTAEHYKAGRRPPSRSVMMLFRLHVDGRVLGPEWEGYRVKGDKLYQPNGKHVTPGILDIFELVWQLASQKAPDRLHEILDRFRA